MCSWHLVGRPLIKILSHGTIKIEITHKSNNQEPSAGPHMKEKTILSNLLIDNCPQKNVLMPLKNI